MTRHSQNRQASAHYSYDERKKIGAGTQKTRVGSEAFRRFNACSLCLNTARDPKCCNKGHIFCSECAISNLLSQKRDIKRQQGLVAKMEGEHAAERELALEKARERVLEDFERAQANGSGKRTPAASGAAPSTSKGLTTVAGVKRKFEVDTDEVERLIKEAEDRALKQLEAEQKASQSARLPNYWLPSLTPEAAPTKLANVKLQTLCQASKPPHPMSLKSLSDVHFCIDNPTDTTSDARISCWACRTSLTNNVKISVLRPCGHALCHTCTDIARPAGGQCPKCDAVIDAKNGIVELAREGTGYASGGQVEIKQFGLAFQG